MLTKEIGLQFSKMEWSWECCGHETTRISVQPFLTVTETSFCFCTMDTGEAQPGIEASTWSWISGTWGRLRESGSNEVKSTYSPRRICPRDCCAGDDGPKGVAALCLHGGEVNVMGGGGLKKSLVNGHELLFITCSRNRRMVSCTAAILASVNGPGWDWSHRQNIPNKICHWHLWEHSWDSHDGDKLQLFLFFSRYLFECVQRIASGIGTVGRLLLTRNHLSFAACCR